MDFVISYIWVWFALFIVTGLASAVLGVKQFKKSSGAMMKFDFDAAIDNAVSSAIPLYALGAASTACGILFAVGLIGYFLQQ